MIAFIQFGVNGHDESDPYAYGMYAAIVYAQSMFIPRTRNIYPRTPTFTPRTPTVMRDCIYTIRCERRDKSDPYAYGMYAAIVYVQPMFTPRTRNIYPRTPTFTPRAPTVGADLSCPHITEYTVWTFFVSFVLFFICAIVSVHS